LKNLPAAHWTILEGDDERAAWETLQARYASLGPVLLRVIGLSTTVHEIIEEYHPTNWIAHALNGIVLMEVPGVPEIRHVRQKHRAVIERAPLEVRRQIATFGLMDAEYDLMKQLKNAFDPEGRLNAGRHVDGERN
jgi:FAD/FMN-containing dehydrogenase